MKYQVFVDVPIDGDWEEIGVIEFVVSARTPEKAREKAAKRVETEHGHYNYYVWEVSEDDRLDDE